MSTVSVAEARNHLSELLVRVEAGEAIGVTRHGKLVARIVKAGEGENAAARRARVREASKALARVRRCLQLQGDLKAIARDGLD